MLNLLHKKESSNIMGFFVTILWMSCFFVYILFLRKINFDYAQLSFIFSDLYIGFSYNSEIIDVNVQHYLGIRWKFLLTQTKVFPTWNIRSSCGEMVMSSALYNEKFLYIFNKCTSLHSPSVSWVGNLKSYLVWGRTLQKRSFCRTI